MSKNQKGFTLIELLVVITIIGILAAIAIPSFIIYRNNGYAVQVVSDIKNAGTSEEAVYLDGNGYTTVLADLVGFSQHPDVTLVITTTTDGFVITATHSKCGGSTWTFDSLVGDITGGPCSS